MKFILLFSLSTFLILAKGYGQTKYEKKDSIFHVDSLKKNFITHFKILDKASIKSKVDTIYCCRASVSFMEDRTDIDAGTMGNVLGTFGFTKEALKKWHEWYNINIQKNE